MALLFLIFFAIALEKAYADAGNKMWSKIATEDLEFVKNAIGGAHPGIYFKDEKFIAWYKDGFEEGMELAKRANSPRQAEAAVGYYTTGFMDGHLNSWRKPTTDKALWAGWIIQKKNNDFVVSYTAPQWPVELPPVGSRVINCDGFPIVTYVEKYFSPFIDRRLFLEQSWQDLLSRVTLDSPREYVTWEEARTKRCIVEMPNGKEKSFDQYWKEHDESKIPNSKTYRFDTYSQKITTLEDGVYWVPASNFEPNEEEFIQLNQTLGQLRELNKAKAIILDTRVGKGGNSGIGERILHAILKQNFPSNTSNVTAFYRVSPFAIKSYEDGIKDYLNKLGPDNLEAQYMSDQLDMMRAALKKGLPVVEQLPFPEESLAEAGDPFKGKLVVITDTRCASSCLNFIDIIKRVPGALHLGLPTSADTNYLEAPLLKSPTGLYVRIPIKVFQGRSRGSNQPYHPDYRFDGEIQDTPSLQRWVLSILKDLDKKEK